MNVYQIDPTQDLRWSDFLRSHTRASIFHTAEWLKTLKQTYRYQPVAFTTSSPNEPLDNVLVCCEIDSWLTGRRLVSLPFSDHCEPLFNSQSELDFLTSYLQSQLKDKGWKYLELRPVGFDLGLSNSAPFVSTASYYWHVLSLSRSLSEIFQSLDKDSVQRRVHHADRMGLLEKCGTSESLLDHFYQLFVVTRGRHRVPPVPRDWFTNLVTNLGSAVEIRIAYKDNVPVAGILTLQFKNTVYYKYGCSDARFNSLGAMPWLLWNAISSAKASDFLALDMGRTEEVNTGLLIFKNHWVPNPKKLFYWKYPIVSYWDSGDGWISKTAQRAFSFMPTRLLTAVGNLIYRHIG